MTDDYEAMTTTASTRMVGVLCGLWCWLGPFFVLPLIVRVTTARRHAFLRGVTAEVLNLQIVALLPLAVGVLAVVFDWVAVALMSWAVWAIIIVYGYVVGVVGAVHAWRGEVWRYPFNLRLVSGA